VCGDTLDFPAIGMLESAAKPFVGQISIECRSGNFPTDACTFGVALGLGTFAGWLATRR